MHSFLKKTLSLSLALSLLAGAAGATTLTGLETETVERNWESSLFFPRMEALTGVSIDAHAVSDEAQYANLIAAMAQGSIPADVLFKANLSRVQEQTLLESGALIDLAPLIEANMPNLSALLAAHPDWRAAITLDDGRIASLPLLNTTERQVCVWINAKWLSALNLSVPTSVAELTDVLLAFKTGDPNGNFKQDEVAADLIGVYEMRWLLPYFGVVADDSNLARLPDGSLAFAPELPAYREWIATLRDWVAQGILPQTAFTAMHSTAALSSASSDEKNARDQRPDRHNDAVYARSLRRRGGLRRAAHAGRFRRDPLARPAGRGVDGLLCRLFLLRRPHRRASLGRCALWRGRRAAGLRGR